MLSLSLLNYLRNTIFMISVIFFTYSYAVFIARKRPFLMLITRYYHPYHPFLKRLKIYSDAHEYTILSSYNMQ